MWQKGSSSSDHTWDEALSYCERMNLGGYTDWRLPTVNELRSIMDFSRRNPAINATYFPVGSGNYYWSSTTYASTTGNAWGIGVRATATINSIGKTSYGYYVRAVRQGQYWPSDHPILSVSPSNQGVLKDVGTTPFSVSNTGTGTMTWSATVTSGGDWLHIQSGDNGSTGTFPGTITCAFDANTGTSERTGTIHVISRWGGDRHNGCNGDPGAHTGCIARVGSGHRADGML